MRPGRQVGATSGCSPVEIAGLRRSGRAAQRSALSADITAQETTSAQPASGFKVIGAPAPCRGQPRVCFASRYTVRAPSYKAVIASTIKATRTPRSLPRTADSNGMNGETKLRPAVLRAPSRGGGQNPTGDGVNKRAGTVAAAHRRQTVSPTTRRPQASNRATETGANSHGHADDGADDHAHRHPHAGSHTRTPSQEGERSRRWT
jgi:hypothetical protein